MGIEFGKNARKKGTYGDIVWSLQYVNGEPALCMWRLAAVGSPLAMKNDGACVICLSSAYKYTGETREEIGFLVHQGRIFAKIMGFDPDSKFVVHRIVDLIQRMLIELVTMQPEPDSIARKPEAQLESVKVESNRVELVLH